VLGTDLKTIVEDRFRNETEEKELSPFMMKSLSSSVIVHNDDIDNDDDNDERKNTEESQLKRFTIISNGLSIIALTTTMMKTNIY
jgi:glycerol-3-phosphate cytidylyltransferase-like family protein